MTKDSDRADDQVLFRAELNADVVTRMIAERLRSGKASPSFLKSLAMAFVPLPRRRPAPPRQRLVWRVKVERVKKAKGAAKKATPEVGKFIGDLVDKNIKLEAAFSQAMEVYGIRSRQTCRKAWNDEKKRRVKL